MTIAYGGSFSEYIYRNIYDVSQSATSILSMYQSYDSRVKQFIFLDTSTVRDKNLDVGTGDCRQRRIRYTKQAVRSAHKWVMHKMQR